MYYNKLILHLHHFDTKVKILKYVKLSFIEYANFTTLLQYYVHKKTHVKQY